MKKLMVFLLMPLAILTGCGVSSLTVDVLEPAQVMLPAHIQTVAIANRSLPAKDDKVLNVVEGLFSGEGIAADREGSRECVRGVYNVLNQSPRFEAVQASGIDLRGTGTGTFPEPLAWEKVQQICDQNNADALILLEAFDSDAFTAFRNVPRTIRRDGQQVRIVETEARLRMDVTAGWRIYDPQQKKVIDEFRSTDDMAWTNTGANRDDAAAGLPSRRGAIQDIGVFAGEQYARRIAPSWLSVNRYYFTKGSTRMKQAKARVKLGDWKGAADHWQHIVNTSSDNKLKGKAAYNLAVASEMEGKLRLAMEWADKAYRKYGNKRARSYINILDKRLLDEDILREQMGD